MMHTTPNGANQSLWCTPVLMVQTRPNDAHQTYGADQIFGAHKTYGAHQNLWCTPDTEMHTQMPGAFIPYQVSKTSYTSF